MFNRSLLRSRVFHRLYALQIIFDGTEEAFVDKIKEELVFDLETGEKLGKEDYQLATRTEMGRFKDYIKLGGGKKEDHWVWDLYQEFKGQLKNEEVRGKTLLLESTEEIDLAYRSIIDFLIHSLEVPAEIEKDREEVSSKTSGKLVFENFQNNPYLLYLEQKGPFLKKKEVFWENEKDVLKTVFLDAYKNDDLFREYLQKEKPGLKDHKEILLHLLSEKIFKNQAFNGLFEDRFIAWFQERSVVRSMVRKFLKELDPKEDSPTHIELSGNWDEDKDFFLELWDLSLKNWKEYSVSLAEIAENWDPERIALADKTLLIMGMNEMVHFPSIPVKVTINEYIELSKKYSTPNSKTFVNGVLDKVSNLWTKSGKIKKSGRGLIDNK